jgi:hypothetical protein
MDTYTAQPQPAAGKGGHGIFLMPFYVLSFIREPISCFLVVYYLGPMEYGGQKEQAARPHGHLSAPVPSECQPQPQATGLWLWPPGPVFEVQLEGGGG